MKYEAVFGNQDLFDGAGTFTGLDVVTRSIASGNMMHCRLSDLTPESLREYPVIAMRRIIQEPKRWTVEDWKDGRLPEVGCDIQYIESQKRVSVVAINANEIVLLAKSNGSKFFVLDPDSLLQYYNPIETPEEKAERLRSEWCHAALRLINDELSDACDAAVIYDALLSGTLSAPTKGG